MTKTLRVRTRTGWTTKPVADLPENRLTAEEVDDTFLDVWDRARASQFVYHVAKYGAAPGASDQSANIQSALDAADSAGGGVVVIDEIGQYVLSTGLHLGDNTTLFLGAGVELFLDDDATVFDNPVMNKNLTTGNDNVHVIGHGCINGNKAGQSSASTGQSGVVFFRCTNSTVQGIEVKNMWRGGTFPTVSIGGDGVDFIEGSRNGVFGVRCHDNEYDGIKGRATHDYIVANCWAWDNGRCGIQLARHNSGTGLPNAGGDDEVVADGTLRFILTGNRLWHSTGVSSDSAPITSGIYLHCASYGQVFGNHTDGMDQGFGTIGACIENRVHGNSLSGRLFGITLEDGFATDNSFVNNFISGEGASGGWFVDDEGDSNLFKNNEHRVTGAGSWGIRTEGTNARTVLPEPDNVSVTDAGTGNVVVRLSDFVDTVFHADATAIIDAIEATDAGSLDDTTKTAINAFVQSGVDNGWWAKMANLYGFVGGTANSHAIDWKAPSGTTITWSGTLTHSANGVAGGGGSGNSGINAQTALSRNDHCIGYYCNLQGTDLTLDGIVGAGTTGAGTVAAVQNSSNNSPNFRMASATAITADTGDAANTAQDSIVGNMLGNRTGASAARIYRDGSDITSNPTTSSDADPVSENIYVLARGSGGAPFTGRLSMAYWGDSLSAGEITDMNTAVAALQTALSRAA